MNRVKILMVAALVLGGGCGEGSGSLTVTTYGEDFIEKQIPAATAGEEGLVDDYTVVYGKFLVALSQVAIEGSDGEQGSVIAGPLVFDLRPAGPHTVARLTGIGARRWERVSVALAPASKATAGNTGSADVKWMNDNGFSVYVEGTAHKGGRQTTFKWGFRTSTRYSDCFHTGDGSGVVVPSGGSVTMELTIHGDHLLYDDLQSSDPSLRFAAVAGADADADGVVTLEELAGVDLTSLPAAQYGTGGAGEIKNLRQFITALTRTLVHFQGEGHCHSSTG